MTFPLEKREQQRVVLRACRWPKFCAVRAASEYWYSLKSGGRSDPQMRLPSSEAESNIQKLIPSNVTTAFDFLQNNLFEVPRVVSINAKKSLLLAAFFVFDQPFKYFS